MDHCGSGESNFGDPEVRQSENGKSMVEAAGLPIETADF